MVEFVPTGDRKQKFIFNVSTPVGAGAKGSSRADILLVQFYFVLHSNGVANADLYRKVSLTGVCDEALIAAIRAYQKFNAGQLVQDGLVSRAQGMRFNSGPGRPYWTIVGMNFGFLSYCSAVWPRLDQHPKCVGELGQVIREAVGAVPLF
ncbi:MAG TPA: hypothetical protein VLV76_26120 [Candidatus Acidoferrum sp.]|nr:hypothetical protein [Candidatus Acidoferrum sp.]